MMTLKKAIIILALFIPFSIIPFPANFLSTSTGEGGCGSEWLLNRVRVITSLFSVQQAEAYTYQDVDNWLAANPAPEGCTYRIERVDIVQTLMDTVSGKGVTMQYMRFKEF